MKYLVVSIHPNCESGGFKLETRYFEADSLGDAEERAYLDIHGEEEVVTLRMIPFEVPLWVQGITEVDPMSEPVEEIEPVIEPDVWEESK